ncbi:hypothetical protein Sjap_018336 [Stephania japonica]|uniref:F-box associated domain-containing protein n=1 Tax=Stephania japonica TaxID=461633 RepID=A0AAP0NN19_9MAGN
MIFVEILQMMLPASFLASTAPLPIPSLYFRIETKVFYIHRALNLYFIYIEHCTYTSGGLLLFRIHDPPAVWIVCNPVTNSHRVLPDMIQIRHVYTVGMIPDCFRIRFLLREMSNGCPKRPLQRKQVPTVWHNGLLYFYCFGSKQYPLVAYDMEKRVWFLDLNVRNPSQYLKFPSVMACRDKLFLVWGIWESDYYLIRRVCVWELNMEKLIRWEKFDELPDEISRIISFPCSLSSFECQGYGDLMRFRKDRSKSQFSIIYNLSKRSWDRFRENDLKLTNKVRHKR